MAYNLESIRLDFKKQGITARIGSKEIKDYIDSTGANREEVVAYFKKKYGENTGINRGQEETTYTQTQPIISSSGISSSSNSNSSSSLRFSNIETGRSQIVSETRSYFDGLLARTLAKEEQTLANYKKAIPAIQTKKDIIDFYTYKTTKFNAEKKINSAKVDIRDYFGKLIAAYASIEGVSPITPQGKQKIDKARNEIRKLSAALSDRVIDEGLMSDPQFISVYGLMTGKILETLDIGASPISSADIEQMKRSGTTLLEFIENRNLSEFLSELKVNPENHIKSFKVVGVGASRSDDLKEFLMKKIQSTKATSAKEYTDLYMEFVKESIDKLKSKGKDVSLKNLFSLGVLTNQGEADASGKVRDDVVDIDVVIEVDDNLTIVSKIDAKLGKEDRYKGSKVEFSAGKTIESFLNDLAINNESFKEFMDLLVLYWVADRIIGKDTSEIRENIIFLMTYSILSSNWFAEKFGFKHGVSAQADFIAIRDTYMWFSDFLRFFTFTYIDKGGGRKPSIDVTNAVNTSGPLILEIKKYSNLIATINDLVQESSGNEEIKNILEEIKRLFLNSGVSFDPDFRGLLSSAGL